MPPQWPDGDNGIMAPRKGLAPYRAFGSAAPCGYRGKFSAGVKGLHSAADKKRIAKLNAEMDAAKKKKSAPKKGKK